MVAFHYDVTGVDAKSYSTAVGGNLGALEGTQDTGCLQRSFHPCQDRVQYFVRCRDILDIAITGCRGVGVVHTTTAWDRHIDVQKPKEPSPLSIISWRVDP